MVSLFESFQKLFRKLPDPDLKRTFLFFWVLSALLFLRPPWTNFVYDEQEALLANPYLLGDVPIWDVLQVDFWGRAVETTIGSYRPLPNFLWRGLSWSLGWNTPFLLCVLNVLVHALNGSLLSRLVWLALAQAEAALRKKAAWGAGCIFVSFALSAEAVSGVVGLSDLLVGFFSLLALVCIARSYETKSLAAWVAFLALVFVSVFLGMMSKESMLATLVPMVLLALVFRGRRGGTRSLVQPMAVAVLACLGLVAQVFVRRSTFPSSKPVASRFVSEGPQQALVDGFFRWFSPPSLPADPLNNPLLELGFFERAVSGLHILAAQFFQLLIPWHLSGDWSYPRQLPAEPGVLSVCGGLLVIAGLGAGLWVVVRRPTDGRKRLCAGGAAFFVLSTLPVANIFFALPTIRAERLAYVPSLGVALTLVGAGTLLGPHLGRMRRHLVRVVLMFLLFQMVQARAHALHYSSDVVYWRATTAGAPASAKAHLNLGVMLGARGDLEARLVQTERAVQLAPDWGMGRIYLGDTFCRRGEMSRAIEEYLLGLDFSSQSKSLTALSLQCIWDSGEYGVHAPQLRRLAEKHPDSWLDYLVYQLDNFGPDNDGIPLKYRPRHYNRRRTPAVSANAKP